MIRRDVLVSQATDVELLAELVSRNGHQKAPTMTRLYGPDHLETLVAIGKGGTARIAYMRSDLEELGE